MPHNPVREGVAAGAGDTQDPLEVRLDPKDGRKLQEILRKRGTRLAGWVQAAIDGARADLPRDERRRAVERIAASAVEDVPEPAALARELEEAHEPHGVH